MGNLKIQGWNAKVYHLRAKKDCGEKTWVAFRNWIFKRDGYRCQMCGERLSRMELSPHHITPREFGGREVRENLITLCHRDHDIAEMEQLTKEQMLDYYVKDEIEVRPLPTRMDWHTWVYGGAQRPQSNMEKSTTV